MQQPSLALQQITEGLAPPRHRSSTDDIFNEPQRLHKVLASCGFGSRRAMEEMILAGRITVNREPADVGQKVGPGDEVRINGELVKVRFAEPRTRILMYHKPAGEIVTRDDPEGRPTVFEKLPNIGNGKWIAIGRLDFNTEGLLLFTNSGELANKMMHPRYEVEREYAVRVMGLLTPEQEQSLLTGIELEDGPGKVEKIGDGGGEGSNHWYHIVIKEGRNREVRRLFEALGLTVSRLIRTRYGSVAMPSRVKRAQTLELTTEEVGAVLVAAGMKSTGPAQQHAGQGPRQNGQPGQAHGKGPRQQGQGQRDRGPRGPRREPDPPQNASGETEAQPESEAIEPGNSVHGLPTHGNTPVGKFFSKSHGKGHGRPQGQGGPRRGAAAQGQGGRSFGQHGRPQHGKPRHADPRGGQGSSPYVMTTLTVPGAVPEGLPGTEGPRHKGPGGQGPRGPGRGNGGNGQGRGHGPNAQNRGNGQNAAGGGQGNKRGRGNRHRNGPRPEATPGNESTRSNAPANIDDGIGNRQRGGPHPATAVRPVDDDIGNRQRGGPKPPTAVQVDDDIGNRQRGGLKPAPAAAQVDDDIGNRQRGGPKPGTARPVDDDIGNRQRGGPKPVSSSGNEAPRANAPPKIDDDIGNR
ncbi:MAG: pseudouridine synthase [Betaproteobacteria bacterium]